MRALVQRVRSGRVSVDGRTLAEIGRGLVILLGVGEGDTEVEARWLANKCAHLRVFADEEGKMNRSLLEAPGEAVVVSQFTLYGDVRKGRRPSFVHAAPPEVAEPLVERFAVLLQEQGVPTQTGSFGAMMLVEIDNDGPVTLMLEREPGQTSASSDLGEPFDPSAPLRVHGLRGVSNVEPLGRAVSRILSRIRKLNRKRRSR